MRARLWQLVLSTTKEGYLEEKDHLCCRDCGFSVGCLCTFPSRRFFALPWACEHTFIFCYVSCRVYNVSRLSVFVYLCLARKTFKLGQMDWCDIFFPWVHFYGEDRAFCTGHNSYNCLLARFILPDFEWYARQWQRAFHTRQSIFLDWTCNTACICYRYFADCLAKR